MGSLQRKSMQAAPDPDNNQEEADVEDVFIHSYSFLPVALTPLWKEYHPLNQDLILKIVFRFSDTLACQPLPRRSLSLSPAQRLRPKSILQGEMKLAAMLLQFPLN